MNVDVAGALAQAAKAQGVKNFVHVSALAADLESPSRWAKTKVSFFFVISWVIGVIGLILDHVGIDKLRKQRDSCTVHLSQSCFLVFNHIFGSSLGKYCFCSLVLWLLIPLLLLLLLLLCSALMTSSFFRACRV